jgi:hypothetical protein
MAKTKTKVSPVIYVAALAAVVVLAVFLNTQPPAPSTSHSTHFLRTAQASDPNGISAQDLNAHFPRYNGGKRDPFVPGVALPTPQTLADSRVGGAGNGWTLTGINSVNGVASALLENSVTGDSVFLQPGDQWNGMRVVSIGTDDILFQNALGRRDSLTFAEPKTDDTGQKLSSVPTVPALPPLGTQAAAPSGVQGLAPYPVAPLAVAPRQTPFPQSFAPDDAGAQPDYQGGTGQDNSQGPPQIFILGGPSPDDNSSGQN